MKRSRAWTLGVCLALVAGMTLSACGGGGSSGPGPDPTGIDPLVLIDMSSGGNDGVPLNQIFTFEFSEALDPDSVRPDTIRIRQGPNYGVQVPGYYEVDGNVVRFYPRLPQSTEASEVLTDAGLQPNDWLNPAGSDYRILLPGSPDVATVRSFVNSRLTEETEVHFRTAVSTSNGLFIDNFLDPLPPRIVSVNPPNGATEVPADSKIILTFNRRPLHPATVNTSNIRLFMESREGQTLNRPLPIEPLLTQSHDSVQVEISPVFPIADQATYRVEVDRRVQDLIGNDTQSAAGGMFISRFSVRDEAFRMAEITITFNEKEKLQYMDEDVSTASWNEEEPDALAALFTVAGGNGTAGDLNAGFNQNFTPNSFQRGVEVQVKDGIEYDVYNFRSINIPQGVTVRFSQRPSGPNRPVILLSLKDINIAGTLTVSGGNGTGNGSSYYTSYYVPPTYGGKGGPGGGNGANNDSGVNNYPPKIMDGGDFVYGGGGGDGGGSGTYNYNYSTSSTYWYAYSYTAGGGGGGGSRTAGKDGEDGYYPSTGYFGVGGKGGLSTIQRGYAYNAERTPNVGGAGGGAGGKGFYMASYSSGTNYRYMGGGGAGGGGGGGIKLQSARNVNVAATGEILADGGDGGEGSRYYYYSGGSAGGGAGGSVMLVATAQVNLEAGATISVAGGQGGPYNGTYTYYYPGRGGDGGDGYIRLEAVEDENSPGKPIINGLSTAKMTYGPPSTGVFAPVGGGAPSIGQTLWRNLGVVDPVMFRPGATDVVSTLFNDSMNIEVQMAVEDLSNLGTPDLSALDIFDADGDGQYDDTTNVNKVSEWVKLSDIEQLNGRHYQFIRIRITFQLDSTQTASDPVPYLDSIRIPFGF